MLLPGFLMSSMALADDLSASDGHYLNETFGLGPRSEIVHNMTSDERATLHQIITNKATTDYPYMRESLVLQNLIALYGQECARWRKTHFSPECPPVEDAQAQPGKDVADRKCNSCHLFGTSDAPPFALLVRHKPETAESLEQALASGHRMSPITLPKSELSALAVYIQSLK
jgi:hypothetical protein